MLHSFDQRGAVAHHRVFQPPLPKHITFGTQERSGELECRTHPRGAAASQLLAPAVGPAPAPLPAPAGPPLLPPPAPAAVGPHAEGAPAGAAPLPPIQLEHCAARSSLPAGVNPRARPAPTLEALKPSGPAGPAGGGKGAAKEHRLSQSEVSRLCKRLADIPTKRTTQNNFVSRVVRDAAPAVVRIDAQRKVAVADATSIFDILFGGQMGQSREHVVTGQGSGFCIDATGIVLTNAHVIEDASTLSVQLQSGKTYQGTVLGSNPEIDLAVVKVDCRSERLPFVSLGNSSAVVAGDWAIALGNPLGLQHSCTLGVISSLERSTGEGGWDWMRQCLLQTDAAINQGNSGGPLLNEDGKVIGIITSRALGADGIGFAVPIDQVVEQIPHILRRQPLVAPCMGIKLATMEPALAVALNTSAEYSVVPQCDGVVVVDVLPKSPADEAGLKKGDVITSCAGSSATTVETIQRRVRRCKVGEQLRLELRRGAQARLRVSVRVADAERVLASARRAARPRRRTQQIVVPGFF